MSVKEALHRLVDTLPEAEAAQLLTDLQEQVDDERLSAGDIAAIERGRADLAAGRPLTLDQVKQKYGL